MNVQCRFTVLTNEPHHCSVWSTHSNGEEGITVTKDVSTRMSIMLRKQPSIDAEAKITDWSGGKVVSSHGGTLLHVNNSMVLAIKHLFHLTLPYILIFWGNLKKKAMTGLLSS